MTSRKIGKKEIAVELSQNPKYWRNEMGKQLLTRDAWEEDLRRWFVKHNKENKNGVRKQV
jgi:hypothetical protein